VSYRLVGHEDVELSWEDLEQLIHEGELHPEVQVLRDGEDTAVPLRSRAEFRHLFSPTKKQLNAADELQCRYCRRRLVVREPVCPWCRKDLVAKPGEASQYSSLTGTVSLGIHVGGHPSLQAGARVAAAADGEMIFFFQERGVTDRSIWIRRDSLTGIDVANETTVQTDRRYTLARVALLGVFALAAPKVETRTHRRYVLAIRWDDRGMQQSAFFQFEGPFADREARAAQQFTNSMRLAPGRRS